jgi:hypothetical protein
MVLNGTTSLFSGIAIFFGFLFFCLGFASFEIGGLLGELKKWIIGGIIPSFSNLFIFLMIFVVFLYFVIVYIGIVETTNYQWNEIANIFGLSLEELSKLVAASEVIGFLVFISLEKFLIKKSRLAGLWQLSES